MYKQLITHIATKSLVMLLLIVISTLISLIVSIFLARILGAAGYGTYAYVLAWIGLISVPAVLGLDVLLVRKIAAYYTQSSWSLMRGLMRRVNQITLIVTILIALLGAVVSWAIANSTDGQPDSQLLTAFWMSLILLPLYAFRNIRQSIMRGLQQVISGQIPERVIQPVLFIILIGCGYIFFREKLTVLWAVALNIASVALAFAVGVILLNKAIPKAVKHAPPGYKTSTWIYSALPLLMVAILHMINTQADILMLGMMMGTKEVGILTVAKRGAEIITIFLAAINMILAPNIASLYAKGDIVKLQYIATKCARLAMYVTFPISFILIAFSNWFMQLFGSAFVAGSTALIILCVGQLINVVMGFVGLLLVMTGHERDAAVGIGISVVINITLNALLIPQWGINGAAIATASSVVVWNVVLTIFISKRLDIRASAFG